MNCEEFIIVGVGAQSMEKWWQSGYYTWNSGRRRDSSLNDLASFPNSLLCLYRLDVF